MHNPKPARIAFILFSAASTVIAAECRVTDGTDDTIKNLLQRLETAVLAGDAESYLDNIDATVPEWATEQANWAADLAEHTPARFDLDAYLPVEKQGDIDLEEPVLQFRMTWAFDDGPEHEVEFSARFTQDEHQNWFYAGEAWTSLASADGQTVVLFLSDELQGIAERITEIMPGIREHVDAGFETHLDHPQVIKLYTDMRHLQQSIYLSYTDPLGGWNEPGEAIKIIARPRMSVQQLSNLLAHEYGHVATFTYHENAALHLPWWVAEGVAELASERYAGKRARQGMESAVRAWAESDSLAAWEDMDDFRETPAHMHGHVYLQGHHFVAYISERFGRTARNNWVRRLTAGDSLDEASREALGEGFDAIEADWLEALRAPIVDK